MPRAESFKIYVTADEDHDHYLSSTIWHDYANLVGTPSPQLGQFLPDFLIVSPPKTGTTWLASNLVAHPSIFIPAEKEVRYFDSLWKMLSIDWYCWHLRREAGQLAGDVSPTYALLPSIAIEHIKRLNPNLKIIFLLRDPIERAWSHLLHMHRHTEGNFSENDLAIAELSSGEMVRNITGDFNLSSGDYEAMLLRWMRYFPASQIHVRYFEDAVSNPEKYYADLFAFLGVSLADAWTGMMHRVVNRAQSSRFFTDELKRLAAELYAKRWNRAQALVASVFGIAAGPRKIFSRGREIPLSIAPEGWEMSVKDSVFEGRQQSLSRPGQKLRNKPTAPVRARFMGELQELLGLLHSQTRLSNSDLTFEDRRLVRILDMLTPNRIPSRKEWWQIWRTPLARATALPVIAFLKRMRAFR